MENAGDEKDEGSISDGSHISDDNQQSPLYLSNEQTLLPPYLTEIRDEIEKLKEMFAKLDGNRELLKVSL